MIKLPGRHPFILVVVLLLLLLTHTLSSSPTSLYDDPNDVVLKAKHFLSKIKMAAVDSQTDDGAGEAALRHIAGLESLLADWRSHIQEAAVARRSGGEAGHGATATAAATTTSPVAFFVNVTKEAPACAQTSSIGSTLRIHFLAKLIATGKVVQSRCVRWLARGGKWCVCSVCVCAVCVCSVQCAVCVCVCVCVCARVRV